MKIAVTGATGSIGRSVVNALASDDIQLTCLSRNSGEVDSGNVHWMYGDLNTPGLAEELVSGQDVIIHLAHGSIPLMASTGLIQDAKQNIFPSLRLIDAIALAGSNPNFIYLSSGGALYEDRDPQNNKPFRESDKCTPVMSYGIQKYTIERYLHNAAINGVLRATVLRVSNAYGALLSSERMQGLIGTSVSRVLAGKSLRIIGNPENVRDYVHIDDVVKAIQKSVYNNNHYEIFNIGSGKGYSVLDVINLISDIAGSKLPISIQDVMGSKLLPNWCVLDVTKARDFLDWRPSISLEQGISMMMKEKIADK